MRRSGRIHQRSTGPWELPLQPGHRSRQRRAASGHDDHRQAAEEELRRLLRTVDTGEHVDPSRLRVREWLTTWLATVREEVSMKSEIVQNNTNTWNE